LLNLRPRAVGHTRILQQHTLPGGGRYTVLKPGQQGKRPIDPKRREHPLKGQFDRLEKYYGYAAIKPGMKLRSWTSEALNGDNGHGSSLYVQKYADKQNGRPREVVVDEHKWIKHRWRRGGPTRFYFKNPGRAMGYMKRRYGLSIPLREWRG